jgi:hypothetical protein
MTNNIKQFPKKDPQLPEECKNTESYQVMEVLYSDAKTKTITDFTTGDQRNRRWGMSMSMSIIPELDKLPPNQAPLLLPKVPSRFFAADSLDELKARVVHEIDKAMAMAKLAVENPEAFMEKHRQEIASSLKDEDDMN